jgi:type IV pilus assembly protein PilY1
MESRAAARRTRLSFAARRLRVVAGLLVALSPAFAGAIDLADTPLFSTVSVPGNLILALSVEWPTATTPAYPSNTAYTPSSTFLGYFDPAKCYQYVAVNTGSSNKPNYSSSYFQPYGAANGHTCSSSASLQLWSGNYLNWASMQTLDAFRWVLTGGYRSVDTVTTTVLTKTYAAQDSSSVIPQKTVDASYLAGATPFTSDKWSSGAVTRIRNLGTRLWISGGVKDNGEDADGLTGSSSTTGAVSYTGQNSYVDHGNDSYAKPNKTYELYVNVKVCDKTVGVETNCVAYGSNYKPEGLMQQYSSKLRYSAFGYYNDSTSTPTQRDGGVMRARMKYIAPTQPVPGSVAIANSNSEWDASTGVMVTNPDPDDALATQSLASASGWSVSIPNSGVMNYLNKFGYTSQSYKSYDPVSELYYAALRYYKNLGNVASYTALSTAGSSATAAQWLDGFPAITSDEVWKKSPTATGASYGSPILYSCQKNFILGIGDVNTHRDANLYGSTIRSSAEPALPGEVSSEDASTIIDVKKATDMVGQLEGLKSGTLGSIYQDSSSTTCSSMCDTYFIAGLAFDAHTRDIRPDLSGKQTVNTYWMDVLEKQVYKHKNQYWLAAKYGGFDVPASFSTYDSSNGPTTLEDKTWTTSSDTLSIGTNSLSYSTDSGKSDKRPDNYFPGNQPETMQSGLTAAFAKIIKEADAATGTALSTPSPTISSAGSMSYSSTYNPKDWTGQLIGSKLSVAADGTTSTTAVWDARDVLESMITKTDTSARKIVTCCTADGAALPFTATALGAAQLSSRTNYSSFGNVSGVSSQSAANFVAYLRGAASQELANGGAYRSRNYRLGDIVGSKPMPVGAPSATYYDATNPGYSAFKKANSGRKTVVYVGANDGMLHAIDGSGDAANGGKELFAYIPSFVYGSAKTAPTDGLAALGNPSYSHRYYVDATPQVFDLDFARAGSTASAKSTDWRSVLIGGLGKGGTGYYAIDVTNPTAWTSETAVAGKVLWEFTDSRMGYSYGAASVVKTKKYGWVAILTSGYNNSDGKGWFFFVNPTNGKLLEAVSTPEGSTSAPINLAHHTAFIPDYTDFTADAVYAGDLQGNVWRLDVTDTSAYAAPVKLAKLANGSNAGQPVTTRPLVEIESNSKKRYVMVGTGRLLADSDISSSSTQSFYAIVDGTSTFGGFNNGQSTPLPITRGQLQANSDLSKGIGSAPDSALGWYTDLAVTDNIAERVNVQPIANAGVVAFAANLPGGDTCSPAGSGRAFTVDFATGKSLLTDSAGALVTSIYSPNEIRELAIVRASGSLRLLAGNSAGGVVNLPSALSGTGKLTQISWREVRPTE